ncbi:MAG: alanyl-tRNA editing protein [Ruminococcaceae bacterium]|nr:alanyl-tRNA editing protein [Oscillospiraceae bacterium]
MTEKLYDIDSHLKSFEATVLECLKCEDKFKVLLNKTAFFPEGGGQPADKGTLDGVQVLDVREEADGIYHYLGNPLEVGSTVKGELCWECRYDRMQNHSGEHIISGIVHRLYGYENVGFHLSDITVTLDFDGELSEEQLSLVERLANEVVWRNSEFKTYYPTREELKNLSYRSKKEIDGDIRIVEIEDCDMCACCAPHVKSAGEIGIIKMLDTERLRGGIRIYIKCGIRALADYGERYKNELSIGNLMSVKQNEIVDGVKMLYTKTAELKAANTELKKRFIKMLINSADSNQNVFFENGLDVRELQMLSDGLYRRFGGIRGAFSETENGVYSFAICGEENALNSFFADFRKEFNVRGGGRNGMVQGTVIGECEKIKLHFNNV